MFNFVPIRYIYIVVNRRDNSSSNSGKISAIMCHKYQNSQRTMIIFIFYSFYIDPLWLNIWRYGRLSLHYMSRSDTWAEVQQFNLWSVAFTNAVLVSRCLALCNELILNILIYPLSCSLQYGLRDWSKRLELDFRLYNDLFDDASFSWYCVLYYK